ncbi:MAG: class II fructose-bisphosphate aldolase [Defluviitaleaceae bacterium]|nr:class II fructose-bisphosphate aldolase [Defluviitaleaceae bacterium]
MALEKSGDILRNACKKGYGVAATNVFNYETIKLAIQKAEEINKPLLIAFYPGWKGFIDLDVVAETTKACAKKVKVPVGLHLDHSTDFDEIMQAMMAGYSSVMYDGSVLPFEENVKHTTEVVRVAKTLDIDVEAELGHVGSAANLSDFEDAAKFTAPEDAAVFVERTGCSSLAVAVGNAHGNYARLPNIDVDRIKAIREATGIPLVLHGGSGIPDEQVQAAVKVGIAKMNVATEYHNAYYRAVMAYDKLDDKAKDMYFCSTSIQTDVLDFLEYKINLLNPS